MNDLSPLLELEKCPNLSNILISHLLWADDLIMLSLTPESSQTQLNKLFKFCNDWGLEINELKTQIIIFGTDKNKNTNNPDFKLGEKSIKIVESYCYLGIILKSSGELRTAQQNLKDKAFRAFFGLKRTINRSKLSFKALCTLFDSLIKPIVLYGAPVWIPSSTINKTLIKNLVQKPTNVKNILSKLSCTLNEKVHLSFLKWALGVHRKSSNVGVWGETGRFPLIYQSISLTLNYYKRIVNMPRSSFINAAINEQKSMNLSWYKNVESLLKLDELYHLDHVSAYRITSCKEKTKTKSFECQKPENETLKNILFNYPQIKPLPCKKFRIKEIYNSLTKHFIDCWNNDKLNSPKLAFYNTIKHTFGRETYLDASKGFSCRYNTTKLRISAHDLAIEKGRYSNIARGDRICHWCQTSMGVRVTEDEEHVLFKCDLYAGLFQKLNTRLKNSPPLPYYTHDHSHSQIHTDSNDIKILSNLMNLLSPHTLKTTSSHNHQLSSYHQIPSTQNLTDSFKDTFAFRRDYIINCITSYINKVFTKRSKYLKSIKDNNIMSNTIVILF